MDGFRKEAKIGDQITGRFGTYVLKEELGQGGNGTVFLIEIINQTAVISNDTEYVIKVLLPSITGDEKRVTRFTREISFAKQYASQIEGLVPIYDSYLDIDSGNQGYIWLLMPRCKKYVYNINNSALKLQQLIELGKTICALHENGISHRDIKPSNLLWYQNRVILSDYGLIWDATNKDFITGSNEMIGPISIRPPEMEAEDKIDDPLVYYYSDAYLFAKTVWIVITKRRNGFYGEYKRNDNQIVFDKNKHNLGKTAEPLHKMMEQATKHNYWERITIKDCINYLEEQLSILNNSASIDRIKSLQYDESIQTIMNSIPPDTQSLQDVLKIQQALGIMCNNSKLYVSDYGNEKELGILKKVFLIKDNIFELEIQIMMGIKRKKKIIRLDIDSIELGKDNSCCLHLKQLLLEETANIPELTIKQTLYQSEEVKYTLNGRNLVYLRETTW